MTLIREKKLRFFCPLHRVGSRSIAQTRIFCEPGKHEFEEDFPFSGKWIYCFDCQRFYPGALEKENKFPYKICLACERKIKRRFLCPECLTFYVETDNPEKKENLIDENGIKFSICAACHKNIGGLPSYLHNCRIIKAEFYTANIECPFCKASIFGEKFSSLSKVVGELESLSYSLNLRVSRIEKQLGESKKTESAEINEKLDNLARVFFRELYKQSETTENQIRRLENLLNLKKNQAFESAKEADSIILCNHCGFKISGNARYCPYCGNCLKLPANEKDNQSPKTKSKLFPALVSHILTIVPNKRLLVRNPLVKEALMPTVSKSDLCLFYLIGEWLEGISKNYIVPSLARIMKISEFSIYADFYSLERQVVNNNAEKEMMIIEPAEVYWDEAIKGFRLQRKGSIRFI